MAFFRLVWIPNVWAYFNAGKVVSGARSNHISFNMLHRDDNTRVQTAASVPAMTSASSNATRSSRATSIARASTSLSNRKKSRRSNPKPRRRWRSWSSWSTRKWIPSTSNRRIFWCRMKLAEAIRAADQGDGRDRLRVHRQAHHAQTANTRCFCGPMRGGSCCTPCTTAMKYGSWRASAPSR